MFITVKISCFEEEELQKISDSLEIPIKDVVELIISRVIRDKKLLDDVIN